MKRISSVSVVVGALVVAGTFALTGMLAWMRAWSIRAKLSDRPFNSWLATSDLSVKTCPARITTIEIRMILIVMDTAPVMVQKAGP